MGITYSMHGRDRKCMNILVLKYECGKSNLRDLDVDRRITEMELKQIGWEIDNWIHLTRNGDQWRLLCTR
jgi:hypothetical protein